MDAAELRARARKHMEEAIEVMPLEEKAAYLEALDKAPFLFENLGESDPMKFLRVCDYDLWMAARRICKYWNQRKSIFGPERAFLPLTLTGDGAMNKQDILSIQAGYPAVLPKNRLGQHVCYFDRRRRIATASPETRFRTVFYLANYLSNDENAQTQGVLFLILLVSPRVSSVDLVFLKRVIAFCTEAMPVKIAHFHLLNNPPKLSSVGTKKQYMIQDLIANYVGCFMEMGIKLAEQLDIHFERQDGELVDILQNDIGLDISAIPRSLGGTWDFTEAISWCRKQALEERELYKIILQEAKKREKAAVVAGLVGADHRSKETAAPAKAAVEDKASKRRAINAMHSRLKRERRRQELAVTKDEHHQLVRLNESLETEQARLKCLLDQASRVLASLERGELVSAAAPTIMLPPSQVLSTLPQCVGWMGLVPGSRCRRRAGAGDEAGGRATKKLTLKPPPFQPMPLSLNECQLQTVLVSAEEKRLETPRPPEAPRQQKQDPFLQEPFQGRIPAPSSYMAQQTHMQALPLLPCQELQFCLLPPQAHVILPQPDPSVCGPFIERYLEVSVGKESPGSPTAMGLASHGSSAGIALGLSAARLAVPALQMPAEE